MLIIPTRDYGLIHENSEKYHQKTRYTDMDRLLDQTFINSIVVINNFKFEFKSLNLNILCIEGSDTEVYYDMRFSDVAYFVFKQDDFESQFDVIDTFLERFSESSEVEFMSANRMEDFWVLRFHSGIHHMIIGFKGLQLSKCS